MGEVGQRPVPTCAATPIGQIGNVPVGLVEQDGAIGIPQLPTHAGIKSTGCTTDDRAACRQAVVCSCVQNTVVVEHCQVLNVLKDVVISVDGDVREVLRDVDLKRKLIICCVLVVSCKRIDDGVYALRACARAPSIGRCEVG